MRDSLGSPPRHLDDHVMLVRALLVYSTVVLCASSLLAQSPSTSRNNCPGLIAAPDSIAPVYNVCAVTEKPVRLSAPTLHFPARLEDKRAQAFVMLELVLDTLGLPEPKTIRIYSSNDVRFNDEALHWIRLAHFRPAMLNGRPVRVLIHIPIQWELADHRPDQ